MTRQNLDRPPRAVRRHVGPARLVLVAMTCVLGVWLLLPSRVKAETSSGRAGESIETVTLTPGHPLRIKVQVPATEKGGGGTPTEGAGGRTIILRIEIEGGTTGGGDGNPPPPPPSEDALAAELRTLYQKDTDPDKAKHAAALAGLYQWGATNISGSSYSDAGSFRKALGEESARRLPTDVLLPLRQRVQVELRKVLPSKPSDPLTADVRSRAGALFTRLAEAMNTAARTPARGTTRRKAGQPASPEDGR